MLEGLVIKAQSGFFTVHTHEGDIVCRVRGRLKKKRLDTDLVAVGDRDCRAFIHMRNTSRIQRRLSLFVVAVPYQVTGALRGSENVTYDASSRVLLIGGKVLFSCDEQPDAHAAYDASTDDAPSDITGFIRRGVLPRSHSAYGGPRKITSAAVRFDVALRPSGNTEPVPPHRQALARSFGRAWPCPGA